MNEERMQILTMLAANKITPQEAERLLAALDRLQEPAATTTNAAAADTAAAKPKPKYLRVMVTSPDNFGGRGPGAVNVKIPIQLLRAGVRLASLVPPEALDKVNEGLRTSGVPIDLNQLKPQHIEDLIEQLDDITVHVDQPETKVQVFCE